MVWRLGSWLFFLLQCGVYFYTSHLDVGWLLAWLEAWRFPFMSFGRGLDRQSSSLLLFTKFGFSLQIYLSTRVSALRCLARSGFCEAQTGFWPCYIGSILMLRRNIFIESCLPLPYASFAVFMSTLRLASCFNIPSYGTAGLCFIHSIICHNATVGGCFIGSTRFHIRWNFL